MVDVKLLIVILQVCLTGTGKFTAEADSNYHSGVVALQVDSGDSVTQFTQGLISLYQYLPEKERTLYSRQLIIKSLFTFSRRVHSHVIIFLV